MIPTSIEKLAPRGGGQEKRGAGTREEGGGLPSGTQRAPWDVLSRSRGPGRPVDGQTRESTEKLLSTHLSEVVSSTWLSLESFPERAPCRDEAESSSGSGLFKMF